MASRESLLNELRIRKRNLRSAADVARFRRDVERATTDPTFAKELAENYEYGSLGRGGHLAAQMGLGATAVGSSLLAGVAPVTAPVTVPLALGAEAAF